MAPSDQEIKQTDGPVGLESSRSRIRGGLFAVVLAFYLISLSLFTFMLDDIVSPAYVNGFLHLIGYIFVATLILKAGSDLSGYFIGKISLICILVFPGFLSPPQFDKPAGLFLLLFALQVAISLFLYRQTRRNVWLRKTSCKSTTGYVILAITLVLGLLYLIMKSGWYSSVSWLDAISSQSLFAMINLFAFFMGRAGAIEEPLIRGFLMGYLLNDRGWGARKAVIVQALLFWLPHIYQLQNPSPLQLTVPLFGLAMGWITIRAKTILPAMLAHAFYLSALAIIRAS